MDLNNLKKSSLKVQAVLNQFNLNLIVKEFPDSTRTAQQAADAIGCQLGQIAKSLIFKCKNSGTPLLVVASGKNRVNEKSVATQIGEPIEKADAQFVLASTGFAIGGIPPIGHASTMQTLIDQDLMAYESIWAAAGTPNAVFKLLPADLVAMTGGKIISVL
ncbi:MAG: YbaK/EbsC family protein [Candidatus Babeliales bacterium]|jgi:prolyl-tRNA editing enzyme YbaK/EbsC (Cys-tRNA(Pro) deacylase)